MSTAATSVVADDPSCDHGGAVGDPPELPPKDPPVDPYQHRLLLSRADWALSAVLGAVLIPLKVVAVLIVFGLLWAAATVMLWGLTDEDIRTKPIGGPWRRRGRSIAALFGRWLFRVLGFLDVRIKGRMAPASEAPVLVVAPHTTFFDALVLPWCNNPFSVSRVENVAIPIVGKCAKASQAIQVSREDPESRREAIREIVRRVGLHRHPDEDQRYPHLIVFPEGSTSNGKALTSFKPGAFYPGKPVQPVLIRYPNRLDTLTWTWNQPHGAKMVFFLSLAQAFLRAEIEFLPVYTPNAEERQDPVLFARNVRDLMAEALGVPTCDMTFEEAKAKYAAFYKNKKLIRAKDKVEGGKDK